MASKQADNENPMKTENQQMQVDSSTAVKPVSTANSEIVKEITSESEVTSSIQNQYSDKADEKQSTSSTAVPMEGHVTPKRNLPQIFPHPEYEARLAPMKERRRAAKRGIQLGKGNL